MSSPELFWGCFHSRHDCFAKCLGTIAPSSHLPRWSAFIVVMALCAQAHLHMYTVHSRWQYVSWFASHPYTRRRNQLRHLLTFVAVQRVCSSEEHIHAQHCPLYYYACCFWMWKTPTTTIWTALQIQHLLCAAIEQYSGTLPCVGTVVSDTVASTPHTVLEYTGTVPKHGTLVLILIKLVFLGQPCPEPCVKTTEASTNSALLLVSFTLSLPLVRTSSNVIL